MAAILVDYENVFVSNGLKGVDALSEDDTLIIFYSDSCRKIRREFMQSINNSGCEFRILKLKNSGKNALDFYIATECGVLSSRGKRQLAIISNDKGFQAVIDYFKVSEFMSDIHIVKAGNIENALIMLDSPENEARKRELQNRTAMLDLVAEHARIEECNNLKNRLKKAMYGTKYENRISEIMEFIEGNKTKGMKNLYTESLHCFGKYAGTEIYRIVKPIVG